MSIFSRILGTLMFKRDVIEDIEKSSGLTVESGLLIIIAFICGVAANYITRLATPLPNPPLVAFFITAFISQAIFTLTWFLVAAILGNACGGETTFLEIVRCMGYAYIISALQLVPAVMLYAFGPTSALGLVASLLVILIWMWALINTVYVLSIALDKGILSALIIGLLAIIIALIVQFVVGILLSIFFP